MDVIAINFTAIGSENIQSLKRTCKKRNRLGHLCFKLHKQYVGSTLIFISLGVLGMYSNNVYQPFD